MSLLKSIRQLFQAWKMRGKTCHCSALGSRRHQRLSLDPLEDRFLLSYSILDLGTLGGSYSAAYAINSAGQVVGGSTGSAGSRAFLYDGSGMHDLGALVGGNPTAWGINDSGQVVGYEIANAPQPFHAFLWDSTNGMRDIGTLGGTGSYASAYAINNSGQVVGGSVTADHLAYHAFLYDGSGMQDLGNLSGFSNGYSVAYGINDSAQVVGYSSRTDPAADHAFLWDRTNGMQDLGTLAGSVYNSTAYAINSASQVVGTSFTTGGVYHAFLYDGTGMQDLGALGGGSSTAFGINDSGQVVGAASFNQASHAFVCDGAGMQDLNALIPPDSGWFLDEARAINNAGQIVGKGSIQGQYHAFLLTPLASPRGRGSSAAAQVNPSAVVVAGPFSVLAANGQDVYTAEVGADFNLSLGVLATMPARPPQDARAISDSHTFHAGHRVTNDILPEPLQRIDSVVLDILELNLLA